MINLLPKIFPRNDDNREAIESALIRGEAKIGGQLFGKVPKGHKREFFCLDEHTWIWHEEWIDSKGKRQTVVTRYVVRPHSIIKSQNGQSYQSITAKEAHNLSQATRLYYQRVDAAYQQMLNA